MNLVRLCLAASVFTITLTNNGKVGHSIDFHASKVAWSDEMRTLNPGESLVYQFKAEFAGFWMYHCGTSPALHHIGNGMFGGVIIDPPNLAPVAHEFVMVQSELYLGPEGKPGDLTKMLHENNDAVVFNGYYNQYKFAPIRVEPNQRVRVWVIDDGPSERTSTAGDPANDYRRAVRPDGARAVTHYRVVHRRADRTTLALTLETGRTHQIRAHLASIHHPIIGDTLYATGASSAPAIALRATGLTLRWA